MPTIVKGHGADTDGADVFLPDTLTVRMYSGERVNLNRNIALFALLDQAGTPREEIRGTIKNYTVYRQDDEFVAQWTALAGMDNDDLWWVGNDIPDSTRLCEAERDGTDCVAAGRHVCSGVLGLVRDAVPDGVLALLACRGSWEDTTPGAPVETAYDDLAAIVNEHVDAYYALLDAGDIAAAENAFDEAGQQLQGLLLNRPYLRHWQEARWIATYADDLEFDQVFGSLRAAGEGLTSVVERLDRVPDYGNRLDAAARQYPTIFSDHLAATTDDVRNALLVRPAIREVRDQAMDEDAVDDAVDAVLALIGAGQLSDAATSFDRSSGPRVRAGVLADPRGLAWATSRDLVTQAKRSGSAEIVALLAASPEPDAVVELALRDPECGAALDAMIASYPTLTWGDLSAASVPVVAALCRHAGCRAFVDSRVDPAPHVQELLALLARDDVAAAEPRLDQAGVRVTAAMTAELRVERWTDARMVVDYARDNELDQVFAYLEAHHAALADVMAWLDRAAPYGRALDTVAQTYPATFRRWVAQASAPVRTALTTRPSLATVIAG